ncbi:FxsB family cyclophane-forming radical SAM/SPASM peptide maturase [Actinomadura opuntiae]|uniref:FxsB family cyclophane-forming radical SAM/SPASM peptide maturase n=1 Tax=Actinomadura sp. OS1-43 TaxID=604315 RepID=UPI00255AA177|nr:FxsB family cyclophane-forming radical SAM/SPASM peptide maturase [Actinomadura sp. OS1-43]MDL4813644.1 FxsB family cyclophane-forming radical SAM/SPASM peptide maturase [Actinomadura sp. OS1-43]
MSDRNIDRKRPELGATPFRQFILKVHSRCNLSCRYCYVYTMADQRWRHRPPVISREAVDATAARIAEHARAHALDHVAVILHGGEPLLAGRARLRYAVESVRAAVRDATGGATSTRFSLQTNGTLLTREFLELFDDLGVRIGVSLDGGAAAHDRARRTAHGGSHARVLRGLAALTGPSFRHLFGGLLCVIDLEQDPVAAYEALLAHAPPGIDLLFPHATWVDAPAGPPGAYARWLVPVFDRWFGADVRPVRIRLFEEMINVLLGGASAVEGVGTTPAGIIVVQTDGHIEQSDTLGVAYEAAADLGLDVFHDEFDAALRHPATLVRQLGAAGVPGECAPCRWAQVCGGGLYPHRYGADGGFDHRSVYCADLDALYGHIRSALVGRLSELGGAPVH